MTVLLDLERFRPSIFDRIAKSMQGTDSGISAPGKDQFSDTPGTDQLVINQVWSHPDQGQISFSLSNNFVARREGNQMSETFQGDGIAVMNELMNCLRETGSEGFWVFRHFTESDR